MAENKKTYVCAICGAEYDTPLERAHCEISCEEKMAEERERERLAALVKDMSRRKKEILEKFTELQDMCSKYSADYDVDMTLSLDCEDSTDANTYDTVRDIPSLWNEILGL